MSASSLATRWTWSFLVLVAIGVGWTVATNLGRLPTGARGYYNRGVVDSREGKLESAIRNLDRALELEPDRTDAYIARAMTWIRSDRPYAAITDADAALRLAPTAVRAHYVRGLAWLRAGRENEALASFQQANEADPSFGRATIAIGNVAFDRGHWSRALDAYRKACGLRHDDDAMHYAPMLVWAARSLSGDRAGAETELRDLIRGRTLDRFRLASWLDAATQPEPAASESEEQDAVLAWIAGVRALARGNRRQALTSFRAAVARAPADSWVRERARAMLESTTVGLRVALENREISSSFSFGPGIEVTCVRDGGPASRSGVAAGDRLVRIDGADASSGGVDAIVTGGEIGREVALELLRGSKPVSAVLVVGGDAAR